MQPSRRSSASQFSCYVWFKIRTLISGKRHIILPLRKCWNLVSYGYNGCCRYKFLYWTLLFAKSQAAYEKLLSCSPQSNDFDAARRLDSATAPLDVAQKDPHMFPGTTGYHNWTSVRFGSFVDQIYMNHETTWQDQLLESSYIMSWSRASDGANFSPKYTTSVLFHRMSERSWKNLHSAHFSWNHSGFSVFLSAFASLFHCVWAWRMRQGRGLWRCCQPANLPDPPYVRHVRCS